ncbi:MAG: S-layer homology domain-containing protein [Candidatus Peribacteraceae bacterium]|nr:S-layer homology domain-containing protein [Candidatus Peribacteraceae bacterium]
MDISRFKKVLAGMSVAAIMLTESSAVFAAYSDVPSGVWYGEAVQAFTDLGYLDAAQSRFRGGDPANRAEFVKLVVMLNGGLLSTPPAVPSFNDVPTGAWYYSYMEEAAKEGWVRGDGDCYGSKPCYARPSANINRAESAALIVRSFGLESTGAAAQFVDNPSGQWYTDAIQTAADHCVLQGDDSTGRVRPGDNMNRAEMVVMLHRVDQGLTYGVDCGVEEAAKPTVKSVVATSATTAEVEFTTAMDKTSAETVANYKVVLGSKTLVVSAAKLITSDTVELTFTEAMSPSDDYTLTVTDVMTTGNKEVSASKQFKGYTALVKGDGELEISVSASNPRGDTLPRGAVGVVMLSTDFTASCKDKVEVETVTVLHEGFGAETDIDGVYATVDGARVTRKRTIDSQDQTSELRFSSPLVIDPCETVTVDIVADLSSTATISAEHNLVVELPSDVASNAQSVTGNFPLRGETFRVAAVTSGIITVDYRTVNPSEVQVGDKAVGVGKFELQANSTEDQTIYSVTLEQNSSASDGDFTNIAIRRSDGTVLTNTVAASVGDFVTLVFDPPFTILEGDKITLEVIADIEGGADNGIIMHFEETSDLFAVGSLYGYGVNGQLYGSQVSIPDDDASTVTIDAGQFTLGINGPATQEFTNDDNDAVLANIEFTTGGEDIDVKQLFIAILGQTSTGAYMCSNGGASTAACASTAGTDDQINEMMEGVEIRNKTTGRTISGVRLTGSTDSGEGATTKGRYQVYRFDDFVVKGDETWEFRVDFISNAAPAHPRSGDKFRAMICGEPTHILSAGSLIANTTGCDFGTVIAGGTASANTSYQMQVEGISTGDKVGDVRPRGNIAGNFQNIANASLAISVKGLVATDAAVENSKNVNLLRFEGRAGAAEDVLLTKLVFEAAGAGNLLNASNYALWVDTDGDGTVDTPLEDGVASQTNQVTFAELAGGGYVLPAEKTVAFEVHGDIASSLASATLQVRFDTGATYLEAEQVDDGASLSGLKLNGTCSTTCDITVTTTDSTVFTLASQGDLFVIKDTSPLRQRQILAGALSEPLLRVQFHAVNEDIDVTDLQFNSSGATATSGDSVDTLELYLDGATTPFATASDCGSDDVLHTNIGAPNSRTKAYCAKMDSQQLVIPKGGDVDVLVRARVKDDAHGGTSNEVFALFIDHQAVSNDATGSGAVRGRESSNNLIANDGDTAANGKVFIGVSAAAAANVDNVIGTYNVVVGSKITSIANGMAATGGMPTGTSDIAKFSFTAATNTNSQNSTNNAVLSGVVFAVNATNVNMSTTAFKLYNTAASTTTSACTSYTTAGVEIVGTASGTFLVTCRNLITSGVSTTISSGQTATFALQANITNPNSASTAGGSSTLQVQLQDFNDVAKKTFGQASGQSRLQWKDSDDATANYFDWIEYPDAAVSSITLRG